MFDKSHTNPGHETARLDPQRNGKSLNGFQTYGSLAALNQADMRPV